MESGDRARNVLVGIVIIIIIILVAVFFIRRQQSLNIITVASPLPTLPSTYQQDLQNNFGITVPSDAKKADLRDVTGNNQMGLVTLEKQNYTVIANLEDPTPPYFYQAWLVKDNDIVSLGKLDIAKGGWMVNYSASRDLSDHKMVWITYERVLDNTPEKHILEGSF